MKVNNRHYRTIWIDEADSSVIKIIDQRWLPHKFVIEDLKTVGEVALAIKEMHVRGAGLIGAAAGFGMYLACLEADKKNFQSDINNTAKKLIATRPTAVNLAWAVNRQLEAIAQEEDIKEKVKVAFMVAQKIADENVEDCQKIGQYGLEVIEEIFKLKGNQPVNILTHCNAGWLAFVDYGTATAPIYKAQEAGIPVHVWVDETRPRNQGARLTTWELDQQGVPYHLITDNSGGHLMQHGMVDLVIVGSDRTTYTGDVANKIGTYLKALAAKDNNIPFYVALPSSTFDWQIEDGIKQIPIEERDNEEVKSIQGLLDKEIKKVLISPESSPAKNYAFDVTPARLITGLITERGICKPNKESILKLFPEQGSSPY